MTYPIVRYATYAKCPTCGKPARKNIYTVVNGRNCYWCEHCNKPILRSDK